MIDLIGHLRSAMSYIKQDDALEKKAEILLELRKLGPEFVDPGSIVYVVDNSLTRALYTQEMRERVSAEDVYALLTCQIGYFNMDTPHHYALVRGWWGPQECTAILTNRNWRYQSVVLRKLMDWARHVMKEANFEYFELEHWDPIEGLDCYGLLRDGQEFDDSEIMHSDLASDYPEVIDIFAIVSRAAENNGIEGTIFSMGQRHE